MKNVVCHSNYAVLNKNGNMLNGVGNVSVKDFLNQMAELKRHGLKKDIVFKTSDEISVADGDAFIFVDMPEIDSDYFKSAISTGKPMFLLAWESGIINARNSNPQLHANFRTIFTYDDTLIDNDKYIKVGYSFDLPQRIQKTYDGKKLCCLIAGNKVSNHPLELYSHRLEAIDWFEKNHPDEFDLYGQGWNKIIPPQNLLHRFVNKFAFINQHLKPKYSSYRGEVDDKLAIYKKYLFSICYENARDLPGYISEKIFDCFFAGCVPVYWGTPNISHYIPENCYIDRRKFKDNEELYSYLAQMRESEYFAFLHSIENFLKNGKNGVFSVDYFSKNIIDNLFRCI
jgi:hypothetical protein